MSAAARALGIPKTTFGGRYHREAAGKAQPLPGGGKSQAARQPSRRIPTISEKDLLSTYDPYERARANMEAIPSLIQRGAFVKDLEIRKAVGLTSDPRLFRELAEDPEMRLLPYQFWIGRGSKEILCWTDPETKQRILQDYPLTTRDVVPEQE